MSESLLRHRAFIRFWFARQAGTAANQMLMVAIGWQMYDLTASALSLTLKRMNSFTNCDTALAFCGRNAGQTRDSLLQYRRARCSLRTTGNFSKIAFSKPK